jgi:hypothetical protein
MFDLTYDTLLAAYGSQQAQFTLDMTRDMAAASAQSWQRLWDASISPYSPLWRSLVQFAQFFAGICILFLACDLRKIWESENINELLQMFFSLFLVGLFLMGDGYFLAKSLGFARAINNGQLQKIYDVQIDGLILGDAAQLLVSNAVMNARASEIISECQSKVGKELEDCLNDPVKVKAVDEALSGINEDDLMPGNALVWLQEVLSKTVSGIKSGLAKVFSLPFVGAAEIILFVVQWVIVNIFELALILTCLFAPIAVALSILPTAGAFCFAWLSGLLSIFAIQLGYAIVVGLMSVVMNFIGTEQQSFGTWFSDMAFLVFAAIFAPWLCIEVGKGGGMALYDSISRAAATTLKVVADTATMAAKALI